MQRRRLMMPPHPVLAQLVWDVVMAPPPEDEVRLLAEAVDEARGYRGMSPHLVATTRSSG
jgi:hypothetical protein